MIVARDHMLGTQVQINYKLKAFILINEASIASTYTMGVYTYTVENRY